MSSKFVSLFVIFSMCIFSFLPADRIENRLTFSYPQNALAVLQELPRPSSLLTNEQLTEMLLEVQFAVENSNLTEIEKTIFPGYLANAQKDFAFISKELTGELKGHFGPITLWILQLFIPNATLSSVNTAQFDPFSSGVAALVTAQASQRLMQEKKQLHDYSIKTGSNLWTPTSPGYVGLNDGSVKTWLISSSNAFQTATPSQDPAFWKKQCATIQTEMHNLNDQKRKAVFWWAGLSSPDGGKWDKIVEKYMLEMNVPLEKRLYARALLESTLLDANAVAFNSKYSFWVKRPAQMDPEIKCLISIPNHPSYPSAHSTIGAAVAVVLGNLFPENKSKWNALAEESGMSRIWGGIHYPIDHEEGTKLGRKVGEAVSKQS